MNEIFIPIASAICLAIGLAFCWPPIERYRRSATVGAFGTLLVVCGVVLMTTFKWTEVAIKISDLEVKLAEAQREASSARVKLAMVQQSLTTEATAEAFDAVLTTYKQVSNSVPTGEQVSDFQEALKAANVQVIPVSALNGITEAYQDLAPKQ